MLVSLQLLVHYERLKTSCVRTMQGRTYLIKHRVFSWPLLHTYYKIARVVELQPNMEW